MLSNQNLSNYFLYPRFEGSVKIDTHNVDVSIDKETRSWLSDVLIRRFKAPPLHIYPYRIRPWSRVFRIETEKQIFYLKIPDIEFSKEYKVLECISKLNSEFIQTIVEGNSDTGAFIMTALNGNTLRSIARNLFDPNLFIDYAGRFGNIQYLAKKNLSNFENLNIPIWTSSKMIDTCASIIHLNRFSSCTTISNNNIYDFVSLLPFIERNLENMTTLENGITIDHGDFQDNNIFIADDHIYLLDWADTNISLPSFSIATYCHSLLLAHPNIENKSELVKSILEKYYSQLQGVNTCKLNTKKLLLIHILYPINCILKVGRLFNLQNKTSDKYAASIIDYWIGVALSFSRIYRDESLGNKVI